MVITTHGCMDADISDPGLTAMAGIHLIIIAGMTPGIILTTEAGTAIMTLGSMAIMAAGTVRGTMITWDGLAAVIIMAVTGHAEASVQDIPTVVA